MTEPLTPLDAEQDDGAVTVRWRRGEDVVSLVCLPSGKLVRIVSPARDEELPISVHVMDLAASPPAA